MGFVGTLLGIFGFGIGLPIGILVGFYFFLYSKPKPIQDPVVRPIYELDSDSILELFPEMPLWVKNPDYDRVDWMNTFLSDMWPYLDKAICKIIRTTTKPIFAEYIGKYKIESIDFDTLTLGTLPPTVGGMKVFETNEKELVMEPAVRWAGNPNIVVVIKIMSIPITIQLVDLQISVQPRISLRPLVPAFPCFSSIVVSLMNKPDIDFGVKVLGGDLMSIPGLYRYVQETIKKQVSMLYLWPLTLDIPILDASTMEVKKPVGILRVKVVRALKLLKMDILGTSDPYVKLTLTGDKLPAKKTTIKKRNLNPIWNENFKFIVKDPTSQVLQLQVFDWDKVGAHDRLGTQIVPLKQLTPSEAKEFTLDLMKDTNIHDPEDTRKRGQIIIELTYVPFKEDSLNIKLNGSMNGSMKRYGRSETRIDELSDDENGAGLLSVLVHGAEDVEGEHHTNPYALVLFRGERKKTKMLKKTRDPRWGEEFQFMLEEAPLTDQLRIEVMSKRTNFSFRSKETLGYLVINLVDVVRNGRINEKYHLIDSQNGLVHVELGWKTLKIPDTHHALSLNARNGSTTVKRAPATATRLDACAICRVVHWWTHEVMLVGVEFLWSAYMLLSMYISSSDATTVVGDNPGVDIRSLQDNG
ncbi:hypothetical protein ACFE04_032028 [Oxalis oulophora]